MSLLPQCLQAFLSFSKCGGQSLVVTPIEACDSVDVTIQERTSQLRNRSLLLSIRDYYVNHHMNIFSPVTSVQRSNLLNRHKHCRPAFISNTKEYEMLSQQELGITHKVVNLKRKLRCRVIKLRQYFEIWLILSDT